MMQRLCLVLSLLAIAGCQTLGYKQMLDPAQAPDYVPGVSDEPDTGYLVGSFTIAQGTPTRTIEFFHGEDGFRYSNYRFIFRPTGATAATEKRSGFVGRGSAFWETRSGDDYKGEGTSGHVYVIPLRAGTYEFHRFEVYAGGSQTTWRSRKDFSLPFEIQAGRALYIGELVALHTFGKNMLGMTIPTGADFYARFPSDRDITLLQDKYPFLADMEMGQETILARVLGAPPSAEPSDTQPADENP